MNQNGQDICILHGELTDIFGNIKFKLIPFSESSPIFSNMCNVKSDDLDINLVLCKCYEFVESICTKSNLIKKLYNLFPDGEVHVWEAIFPQICAYLINEHNDIPFIYVHRDKSYGIEVGECNPRAQNICHRTIFSMYVNNLITEKYIEKTKCPWYTIFLIPYKNVTINGVSECIFIGLTVNGLKLMTMIEWAKYMKHNFEKWIENSIMYATFDYENRSDSEDDEKIDFKNLSTEEKDKYFDKMMKSAEKYSFKKDLEELKLYFDIGFFDIWECGNGKQAFAINIRKNIYIKMRSDLD